MTNRGPVEDDSMPQPNKYLVQAALQAVHYNN